MSPNSLPQKTNTTNLGKRALRRNLRNARRALTPAQQQAHSASLVHNTLKTLLTLRFNSFALYLPADGEIDTWPLINKLLSFDLSVGLPSLRRNVRGQLHMNFARFTHSTTLVRGHYNLLEPAQSGVRHTRVSRPFIPDVLFTPLVGFDMGGHRLGWVWEVGFMINTRTHWNGLSPPCELVSHMNYRACPGATVCLSTPGTSR